jgi:DNA-binding NarL/FixJ family response regulator
VQAIRQVAAGCRFVSPHAAAALAEGVKSAPADEAVGKLSNKERVVFQLLGQGADASEIGSCLGISSHTVESYFARILFRLRLNGVHELRRHAIAYFQKHAR